MKLLNKEIICYFDGYNIKDNYDTCVSSYQDDKTFSQNKFEILPEEDEEIDIDKITEIYINNIKSVGESETKCWTGRSLDITFANKLNKVIRAVKQLNKKLEEK